MLNRIEKVAVIGSGIMGGGIAALCASAGIRTLLLDIVPFDLKDTEKNDPKARNRIVEIGLQNTIKAKPAAFMDGKVDPALVTIGNLEDDFDKLKECDLIVEVIVENLKIKQSLFSRIEKIMTPNMIIASNTSGLPLANMAEGRSRQFKENFLITHFFNPVRYMKLLEVVPGVDTRKEIVAMISAWGEKILGKGIVIGKDTPNFIGNRIGVHSIAVMLNSIKDSGVTIEEVDAVLGPPLGRPRTGVFGLSDLVGLDTLHHLLINSKALLPNDEAREVYNVPDWFQKMIDAKLFGNKTKAGFFKKEITPDWKKKKLKYDFNTGAYVDAVKKPELACVNQAKAAKNLPEKVKIILYGEDKVCQYAWQVTAASLIYSANRIPEIADSIVEIDNAMKWGYNYEVGPFEMWDMLGVKKSVAKMEADGLAIPENVKKMLAGGNDAFYKIENGKKQYFDFASGAYKPLELSDNIIFLADLKANNKVIKENDSASLIDLGDGVFNLEFHTKMNALNFEIVETLAATLDYVHKNGAGLVIGNQAGGMPGAWSAGADLLQMLNSAKEGKFDDIALGSKTLQDSNQRIRYSPFPVVGAPYGLVLGGGCEICLAADRLVAHSELYMGLVEIGAGLLPGGGGHMMYWRKVLESIPADVTVTDFAPFFITLLTNIGQAKTSTSAAEAKRMGLLGLKDRIVYNKDYLIGEAKKEVLKMVDEGYMPPAQKKLPVMGREGYGMALANLSNMEKGGYVPGHMGFITKKIATVLSGGDVIGGLEVPEEHLLKTEREAFVELWKTENTQKMAEHMLKNGKPLFI
jgi:3-hydroxyacyl-CoA dehydrogenase